MTIQKKTCLTVLSNVTISFSKFYSRKFEIFAEFFTSNTFILGFQTGGKQASKQKEDNTRIKDANVLKECAGTHEQRVQLVLIIHDIFRKCLLFQFISLN